MMLLVGVWLVGNRCYMCFYKSYRCCLCFLRRVFFEEIDGW